MTGIKLCGLTRTCDIEAANALKPDYVGFVFARRSRRYIAPDRAMGLGRLLRPEISAVGVFANEEIETIARLLDRGIIDIAQLHGGEDEGYIARLRARTSAPIIKAFRISGPEDIRAACASSADYILLDSGEGGTGSAFNWNLLGRIERPWFLAGGLNPANVGQAVRELRPWAVDTSSGIETNQLKDAQKMRAFVRAVREQR